MTKNISVTNSEALCVFNDKSIGEQYCSFNPDTIDGKIKLYNAINSPDERLKNVINMPLKVKDVVIRKVELVGRIVNDGTGDTDDTENPFTTDRGRESFRVILLDVDGKSYTATSTGIYNSVCTLRSVFGGLHFEEGLNMVVKQISTRNGNTLTLSIMD